MLRLFLKLTVRACLLVGLLAVFFSAPAKAQEYSLGHIESGLNDLIYDLSRSVVTVEATGPIYPDNKIGLNDEALYSLVSTGVIYDSGGHIVTMASSVLDRSTILVKFENQILNAKLIGIDYQSGLAVLKVPHAIGVPVEFSNVTGCAGQMVVALGNAYGMRVSPSLGFCAGYRPDGIMQFSAMFSSGTNGGGLFSLTGTLIGMISGSTGENLSEIGLAIPSMEINESAAYMIKNGSRSAGYLGLTTTEIVISPPLEIEFDYRLASNHQIQRYKIEQALVIDLVMPNSPAFKAGLKKDDLIIQVNNRDAVSAIELARFVKHSTPGTDLNILFLRNHEQYNTIVSVGEIGPNHFSQKANNLSSTDDKVLTDSILKELSHLKARINYLESRLKSIK